MTRDEAREFAKVVQAYADGKEVQMNTIKGWRDIHEDPCFDGGFENYRIKEPGPREWWLVAFPNGTSAVAFDTSVQAHADASRWRESSIVHVREVTP